MNSCGIKIKQCKNCPNKGLIFFWCEWWPSKVFKWIYILLAKVWKVRILLSLSILGMVKATIVHEFYKNHLCCLFVGRLWRSCFWKFMRFLEKNLNLKMIWLYVCSRVEVITSSGWMFCYLQIMELIVGFF